MARFAEYHLGATPDGVSVSMPLPCIVLRPGERVVVARAPGEAIFVTGPKLLELGWGGRRNHGIAHEGDAWQLWHMGHGLPLTLNGERWWGRGHELADGDRVEPAKGLVFVFRFRDDLEPLHEELARRGWQDLAEAVLLDWVMERGGFDADGARRALEHLRTRLPAPR